MAKRILFFADIQPAQHQNTALDASFAQYDALVGRSHAKPPCTCLLKRGCALLNAVSVSVAFHNGAYGHVSAYVFLQNAKIVAQSRKRNFSPVRPGFDAGGCKGRSQSLMIQAVIRSSPVARG